jgi:MazG family protein
MAAEDGRFDIGDVVEAITTKLIRRHPHVFGDVAAREAGEAKGQWERIKAEERAGKAESRGMPASILDDVPRALPELARAEKLAKRAASVGFDWPDNVAVLDKAREEFAETEAAIASGEPRHIQEELGDLLMAIANLARKVGVDPEAALRDANAKFIRRFHYVEARAAEDGVPLAEAGLERLDGYWNEIRAKDQAGKN